MSRALPTRRTDAPPIGAVLLPLAWTVSAALGWGAFHLLGGDADAEPVVAGCILLASVVALGLTRLLEVRTGRAAGWAALVAIGWGAGNAAGWSLAVEVGGPLVGLATGVAVAGAVADPARVTLRGGCTVWVVGLVAVLGCRLLPLDPHPVLGLLVSLVAAVGATALARRALVPGLPMTPVVVLAVGGGIAWVGSWLLADALLSPVSVSASIAAEVLLAVALGAAVLGWLQAPGGEPVLRVVLRWTALALAGLVVAVLLALLASVVLPVPAGHEPGPVGFLDLGTTIGLGAAAWLAARPTLGRPLRRSSAAR